MAKFSIILCFALVAAALAAPIPCEKHDKPAPHHEPNPKAPAHKVYQHNNVGQHNGSGDDYALINLPILSDNNFEDSFNGSGECDDP